MRHGSYTERSTEEMRRLLVVLAIICVGCNTEPKPVAGSPCAAKRPLKQWTDGDLAIVMIDSMGKDVALVAAKEALCRPHIAAALNR